MKYKILYNMVKRVVASLSGGDPKDHFTIEPDFTVTIDTTNWGFMVIGNPPKIFGGDYERMEDNKYIVYRYTGTTTSGTTILVVDKETRKYYARLPTDVGQPPAWNKRGNSVVELEVNDIEVGNRIVQGINNSN